MAVLVNKCNFCGFSRKSAACDGAGRGICWAAGTNHTSLKRRGIKMPDYRLRALFMAGNKERCLGQTVAWIKGRRSKPAARKCFCETLHGFRINRLGSAKCNAPAAQIESVTLLFGDTIHAVLIAEIGTAADGSPEAGYCLEPAFRALYKRKGRHHDTGESHVNRLKNRAD